MNQIIESKITLLVIVPQSNGDKDLIRPIKTSPQDLKIEILDWGQNVLRIPEKLNTIEEYEKKFIEIRKFFNIN